MITLIGEKSKGLNFAVKLEDEVEFHEILEYQRALIKTIRATTQTEQFADLQEEICVLMELLLQLLPTHQQITVLNEVISTGTFPPFPIQEQENELT